jgi:hypothetical protein
VDLIDRESLVKWLKDVGDYFRILDGVKAERKMLGKIIDHVEAMPTVDAVPVVRCKDCKWCRCYDKLLLRYECTRFLGSMQVREDDFCSHGKRKDGE